MMFLIFQMKLNELEALIQRENVYFQQLLSYMNSCITTHDSFWKDNSLILSKCKAEYITHLKMICDELCDFSRFQDVAIDSILLDTDFQIKADFFLKHDIGLKNRLKAEINQYENHICDIYSYAAMTGCVIFGTEIQNEVLDLHAKAYQNFVSLVKGNTELLKSLLAYQHHGRMKKGMLERYGYVF